MNKKIKDVTPQNNNNNPKFWKGVFGGVVGTVVTLSVAGGLTYDYMQGNHIGYAQEESQSAEESTSQESQASAQTTESTQGAQSDTEQNLINVVEKTQSAVVSVENHQNPAQAGNYPALGADGGYVLGDAESQPVLYGTGSGVVYKVEGDKAYIVTNAHVIDGADSVEVTMADGQDVKAELVGQDTISDLAVLTIPAEYAKETLKFANSDEIKVGSHAIAIGSPIGSEFASSVTQGIVSGLDRNIPIDTNQDGTEDWSMQLIQTDAAINPGNSGGALVNSSGQLIGINSSKLSASDVEGMGFAIPSNEVNRIVQKLEENGEVTRPALGVAIMDLSHIAKESRQDVLKLDPELTDGVVVAEVNPDSDAERAGIQKYDVIVGAGDKPVTNMVELRQALFAHDIGDTIELKVLRDGKEETVKVELTQVQEVANQPEVSESTEGGEGFIPYPGYYGEGDPYSEFGGDYYGEGDGGYIPFNPFGNQ
ncbi:S1C family serine protease [Hutsoniella sourekii]|uniref:S1C family serine protease n=1 Tax=Hutsoniella sourekii TaxID=87650 RepID=UPI0004B108C5|nr:trypsin-like peptidase domain-containing protein [Hutsoniella sourekii]